MYCKKCGSKLEDGSLFCSSCGAKVVQEYEDEKMSNKSSRKFVYDGDIHKCPNCGEILKSFVTTCPSCGYELRGTRGGSIRVEEFATKLEKITSVEKKRELISNFYIPNTKEDIIEFFTLAVSQIDDTDKCSEAWINKLEQTLMKAKLTFGDTAEYKYIDAQYKKAKKRASTLNGKRFLARNAVIIILLLILAIGVSFIIAANVLAQKQYYDDAFESPFSWMVFVGMYTCIGDGIGFLFFVCNGWEKREAKERLERLKATQSTDKFDKENDK